MFVSRPAASLIRGRLDAEAYNPEFLGAAEALAASGLPVESVDDVSERIRCGPFGSSLHASRYVEDGVPFIAPVAFSSGHIEIDAVERISKADHARLQGTSFRPPSIVFARVGHPHVAAVPESFGEFNIHGDVIGAKLNEGNDAHFMYGYFTCAHGGRLLRQAQAGTTRPRINTPDLSVIPVVRPRSAVQRYIGSKVRQAEALREWARSTEARFRYAVALDVPDATGRGRQSRVSSRDLDLDLNPGRFTPDRLEVRRALSRSGARLVESFATIAADNVASPAPSVRYLGLDGISTSSIDLTLQRFSDAGVSGTCRALPRGAAISKLRPYLNKAVFIPGGPGQVVGSTELLCLRSEAVHPGYLYGVLKLDTTVRQLNPVASGATHPRVGPDEVLDLLVPWRDDHDVLGASLERAQLAYFGARSLVTTARLLVEALIERKVTETELIEAGKDVDADRALLARLAEDGLDGAGAPLFADLDGLAALTEEAKRPGGDS